MHSQTSFRFIHSSRSRSRENKGASQRYSNYEQQQTIFERRFRSRSGSLERDQCIMSSFENNPSYFNRSVYHEDFDEPNQFIDTQHNWQQSDKPSQPQQYQSFGMVPIPGRGRRIEQYSSEFHDFDSFNTEEDFLRGVPLPFESNRPILQESTNRFNNDTLPLRELNPDKNRLHLQFLEQDVLAEKPSSQRAPIQKIFKKVFLPQNDKFNYVGLIIGPKGFNKQLIERKTSCKIYLRGKGSARSENIDQSEDLHVLIEALNEVSANKAMREIENIMFMDEVEKTKVRDQQLRSAHALGLGLGQSNEKKCSDPAKQIFIIVPNYCVALIIGKKGETIKQIQKKSGAEKVYMQSEASREIEEDYQYIIVEGSPESVQKVRDIIEEIKNELRLKIKNEARIEMDVPDNMAGLVIGKNGQTLQLVADLTGTRCQIMQNDGEGQDGRKYIIIFGKSHEQCMEAKAIFQEKIDTRLNAIANENAKQLKKQQQQQQKETQELVKQIAFQQSQLIPQQQIIAQAVYPLANFSSPQFPQIIQQATEQMTVEQLRQQLIQQQMQIQYQQMVMQQLYVQPSQPPVIQEFLPDGTCVTTNIDEQEGKKKRKRGGRR